MGQLSLTQQSRPERPVQSSVLNGLRDMFGFELRHAVEIGNRASDFQDAVMSSGAESLLGHGAFQQPLAIGGELAELPNRLRRHLGVAVEFFASGRKARQLDITRADHAPEDFA